jgi:hypothetical protein
MKDGTGVFLNIDGGESFTHSDEYVKDGKRGMLVVQIQDKKTRSSGIPPSGVSGPPSGTTTTKTTW